uniref:DUF659 domain-containing protein n=1 Tax=Timema poppense TaxID=170557 RepID=A0A7R9HBC4_TIMPO|nr:unnamed protein product [Timema poppensis]
MSEALGRQAILNEWRIHLRSLVGQLNIPYSTVYNIVYIANIVVSKLDSTGPSSLHLIASRVLKVANSSTIARVVRDSLRVLWPSENNDEKFMVLLTDSAAYMLKAGASLKVFYPKLIHVTCLAHTVYSRRTHSCTVPKYKCCNFIISESSFAHSNI